jgi:hypothetical protein
MGTFLVRDFMLTNRLYAGVKTGRSAYQIILT